MFVSIGSFKDRGHNMERSDHQEIKAIEETVISLYEDIKCAFGCVIYRAHLRTPCYLHIGILSLPNV